MKSSRLLIHELELEIQGVSIEWVKQHQDSIVEKLTQIFNNFQLNEEQDLFIDFIEIDIGKFNNFQDFIQFLELEILRWNRELINQRGQLSNLKEPSTYYELIENEWDSIFKETKDFFNPDISSDTENLKRKFLEISELLQRNPEQFWRWFQGLGISEELIIKFRKFLYSHQLPNEAIVAWTTSMLVIKDKNPAESYEKVLSQILIKNFTKSNKFSIFLKRNDDEFIQLLNNSANSKTLPSQNNLINISEADWNTIENMVPWEELLSATEINKNIIYRIPLPYLFKLLKSSSWDANNFFRENLSVYLINNNIISKDELHSEISLNNSNNLVYSILQWVKNSLPINQKSSEIGQIFYLLLTDLQNKASKISRLRRLIKTLDLEINQEENEMLLKYWNDLLDNINLNKITIQHLAIKIQHLITLSINLSVKTKFEDLSILDILNVTSPKPINLSKLNNINNNIDQFGVNNSEATIQNTNQLNKIKPFIQLFITYYHPLLRLFDSNNIIKKLIREINIKIEEYSISTQSELSLLISQILKLNEPLFITNSLNHLIKPFTTESEEKQELILWLEWLDYLNKSAYTSLNNSYDYWKLNHKYKGQDFEGYLEKLNSDILAIAKSEIERNNDNTNKAEALFTEDEILWFNSFFEQIEKETLHNGNIPYGHELDIYFSFLNLLTTNDINQILLFIKFGSTSKNEFGDSYQIEISRIRNITNKLKASTINDLLSQYENHISLIAENFNDNSKKEINNFKAQLLKFQNNKSISIQPNQQLKELIAELLLHNSISNNAFTTNFHPTDFIYSAFQIYELWVNKIQEFTNSNQEEPTKLLEIQNPKFSEIINEWIHDTKEINQRKPDQLTSSINQLISKFLITLQKLDFIIKEITRSSANDVTSTINHFYQLNTNTLISGLFSNIKVENHIGSTMKLNFILHNFLTGTAAIFNEIIQNQLILESSTLKHLDSIFNINNVSTQNISENIHNYYLLTLLSANNQLQSQIPEITKTINSELKLTLVYKNENKFKSAEQHNLYKLIFNNSNQIPINSPINTWANNAESTFYIDQILTNINLFINLIQNPSKISIITHDTNSNISIQKYITKIEFINLLFGHPKWRELYVQLTRNGGYGFKQISQQLTLLETIQVIGNKFPKSTNLDSEIKQIISDLLSSKNYNTEFLQTFKFYWVQQTTPPSPLRTLQIILETYFSIGISNILEIIQSTIIPSRLFKHLTRIEKKEFDQWIGNQIKNATIRDTKETETTSILLNHISHRENPIPFELFINTQITEVQSSISSDIKPENNPLIGNDSSPDNTIESIDDLSHYTPKKIEDYTQLKHSLEDQNYTSTTNVNQNINTTEKLLTSKLDSSNDSRNILNSSLSYNLSEKEIEINSQVENSIKTYPSSTITDSGDSFITNYNDWKSIIYEIKKLLIVNHTISERIIAEQIYLLIEKKLPKNHENHELRDILKSIISLSMWFEILDQLPNKIYHRFSNYNNTQQEAAVNLIKDTKNSFSNESKVNFLSNIISDYLFFKTNHWLFSESFNSISEALIEIKKNKPTIYKSTISKITSKNGNLDRHWSLPLFENNPFVNNGESIDSLISTKTILNEKSTPIFSPIIERNWSIWQRNTIYKNNDNSELNNIIINHYLTDLSIDNTTIFTWLDKILSTSYLNNNSLFAELIFNKTIVNEWFLHGNIKLEEINFNENGPSSIIKTALDQANKKTNPPNSNLAFFSILSDFVQFTDNKTHESINYYFGIFHQYLNEIHKEIGPVNSVLTQLKLLTENDLMDIYNFNVLKFFLSNKKSSTDWLLNKSNTNNSNEIINKIISALANSQTENLNIDREEILNYLEKFQQVLNLSIDKKSEIATPIYWEISSRLILNALVDKSIELIEWNESSDLKSQITQNRTTAIEDLFDRELLKESIKENIIASLDNIESNFKQTSNVEVSLILYWLSENIKFQLDDFSLQDNPLFMNFNAKSSQIPESEHIIDLILQPLMLLNYESGLSTNDYFKETLVPILLLTATYNKSKQIKIILDTYSSENRNSANLKIGKEKVPFIKTETETFTIDSKNGNIHSQEIEIIANNYRDSTKNDDTAESDSNIKEAISSLEEISTSFMESLSLKDNISTIEDITSNDSTSNTGNSISNVLDTSIAEDISSKDNNSITDKFSIIEEIKSEVETTSAENTVILERALTQDANKYNNTISVTESNSVNLESGQTDTNKTPLIQLPYSIDSIIQQLFNGQPDHTGQLQNALEDILKTIPNSEIDKIVSKIKEIWEKQIKPLHIIEGHIQKPDLFKAIEGIPSVKKIEIKKTEEIKQDNTAIKKAVNQGTRFATGLCGMIMLAPYYGTLFRRMNLIENNNFKSELEQLKAYSIIFHIAKLHEETPSDYQDLVPRIIVGIPPEASISGILQLTADELEEIEKFLTAVKSQWKLMNNVTLRGFIQSFLLRTGKVWKEGDKWKIEVDTHGADIILKTVPWGFSFIKYPWNPYIIETKWELD